MALIVVQAGHYPRTRGATGTGGLDGDPDEQEFNWRAANECAREIREAGHQCRVIGADVADANYRGDAFFAIHCDGSTNPSAKGASVGYRNNPGHDLAQAFKLAYAKEGWKGGWRPDNYTANLAGYYGTGHATRQGNDRAVVLEAGFLTNPDNERDLSLPEGPRRLARAVRAAVVQTFGGKTGDDFMAALTDAEQRELLRLVKELRLGKGTEAGLQSGGPARDDEKTLLIGALKLGLTPTKVGETAEPGQGVLIDPFKAMTKEALRELAEETDTAAGGV